MSSHLRGGGFPFPASEPHLDVSRSVMPSSLSHRNSGIHGRVGSLCVATGHWSEMESSASSAMTTVPPGAMAVGSAASPMASPRGKMISTPMSARSGVYGLFPTHSPCSVLQRTVSLRPRVWLPALCLAPSLGLSEASFSVLAL